MFLWRGSNLATVLLKALTKRFGEGAAVDHLDLEIADGEFVSLLGPSGCGKTTTLRLIAGFLSPDEGEIRVNQELLSSRSIVIPPEKRQMSMIFQSYAVWPHMTVFQNVTYGLKLKRLSRGDLEKKAERLLRLVHLDELRNRYPSELSGGQQQRVALARALVVEPQILLLDEPLSNLDANLREEMRFEIRRLHEEFRITTVYVTHDQAEAMVTSDRIAVMDRGKIIQVGTPQEIFDLPKTRFVAEFIGKTNILLGCTEVGEKVRLRGGLSLTAGRRENFKAGADVAVCIRPHNLFLIGSEGETSAWQKKGFNIFCGIIQRRVYFGDGIDYTLEIAGDRLSLRVVAPPSCRYQSGEKVFAAVHPDHCIVLGEG